MAWRRLTWWQWVLAVALVLMLGTWATLAIIRYQGMREWQAYVAVVKAAGGGVDAADFVASLPPVDTELQEAWWEWSETYVDRKESLYENYNYDFWSLVQGKEPLRQEFADFLTVEQDLLARGRALFSNPGFVPTLKGYAAADMNSGVGIQGWRMPYLFTTKDMVILLQYEMVFGDNHELAFRDAQQLMKNIRRPGCLTDAMIAVVLSEIIDESYLASAWIGRPSSLFQAWMADQSTAMACFADGYDGERQWSTGQFMTQAVVSRSSSAADVLMGDEGTFYTPWDSLMTWVWGPAEGAATARDAWNLAKAYREGSFEDISRLSQNRKFYSLVQNVACYVDPQIGDIAWRADVRHRLYRLAARVLIDARSQGLPADEQAWADRYGRWCVAEGDQPALVYERLADDRFRVALSPDGPYPNYVDLTRYRSDDGLKNNDYGKPAQLDEAVVVNPYSIEMQVSLEALGRP